MRSEQQARSAIELCLRPGEIPLAFTWTEIVGSLGVAEAFVASRSGWMLATSARLVDAPGGNLSVSAYPWSRVRGRVRRRLTGRALDWGLLAHDGGDGRVSEQFPVLVSDEFAAIVKGILNGDTPITTLPGESTVAYPTPLPQTNNPFDAFLNVFLGATHEYQCNQCGQSVGAGTAWLDTPLTEMQDQCRGCSRTVTSVVPLNVAYPGLAAAVHPSHA